MKNTLITGQNTFQYKDLTKTGLKKVSQTPDFKICLPDYTQSPDIYVENMGGLARKDGYKENGTLRFKALDEFVNYIGANEPTTYYFIPIANNYFQNTKKEILLVDRFMPVRDKDFVVYAEDGKMHVTKIRLEANLIILQDSMKRYAPEQFQREVLWGVIAGVLLA